MIPDLEGILNLSAIDQEIFQIKRKKSDLPAAIEAIKADMSHELQEINALDVKIKALADEYGRLEIELQEHQDGLKKSDDKLMLIKTNEEYDAVHSEIATRKIKITESEERILQITAEKEALEKRKEEAATAVDNEEHKKKLEELSRLEAEYAGLEADTARREAERAEMAKSLNPKFLHTYDRLHKAKKSAPPVGLVSDKRRSCGVCGCALTAQRFIEVKRNKALNLCEACGSILIWKADEPKSEEVKA